MLVVICIAQFFNSGHNIFDLTVNLYTVLVEGHGIQAGSQVVFFNTALDALFSPVVQSVFVNVNPDIELKRVVC